MFDFFKKPKKEEEKCSSCNQGVLIKKSNEGGNLVKTFSCGHRRTEVSLQENISVSDSVKATKKIVREINEPAISVSDSVSVNLGLYFELTEPVSVSGIKQNSPSIELIFENNSNMLKAFRINVANFQDKKQIISALQQASRFTNLITLKTGIYVFHNRPRKIINGQISNESISYTMDAVLTKLVNLDMTKTDVQDLLDGDTIENQQLAHFANGQKALRDANFGEAIREFHQVIENENLPHLDKYKYLRDGVSHAELQSLTTIQKLKDDFRIVCIENPQSSLTPKGKYVDFTSPEVQDILEKEANYLRNEVIRFLDTKVNVKTN